MSISFKVYQRRIRENACFILLFMYRYEWCLSNIQVFFFLFILPCMHLLGNLLPVSAAKFSDQHLLGIPLTFFMWIYNALLLSSACLHILYQHDPYSSFVFKSSNNLTYSCHRQFWGTLIFCLLLAACLLGLYVFKHV